jgi:RNA polymerase sigma factor (sigma-70 family)
MSDSDKDFKRLMEGLRNGDEDAARELVQLYGESLRRAVRRVLSVKLQSKFDSIDFVQIVWKSFFCMDYDGLRVDSPKDLAEFLIGMARNKVRDESRKRLRLLRYDVRRERDLGGLVENQHPADDSQQPIPVDVAIARERWEELLRGQPEHCREIVRLKLCGHGCHSVAEKLDLDEETVRRYLKKLFQGTSKP